MSNAPDPLQDLLPSPCTGICRLDPRGYCVGCQRSGEEIGRWRAMSDFERLHVMKVILPARRLP
ncbi:MAG: DUF1289 domain-containing protein [Rhodanobacter sp.]|nr:MAG: DUF1289 domain-containing protein [Rhodanobacter sp.]TAM07295.1 MAG: DUF1289 domain-containing protein [Rhodanobacter sp.]TAM42986.1 MAG: DUF1289 domain-containing protein [Rhodanobacter sp.]TAN28142.1 MAG: DUF1289 domain-containing protein [Rhodanobacter sp.]